MPKLIYVPLEPYQERYTMQLSAPETGWFERNWLKYGVNYLRVEGVGPSENRTIQTGQVLDAVGRTQWAFSQIHHLLNLIEGGEITYGDAIYFDDFFHPGLESVRYLTDQTGLQIRMYSFLWAQSVDEFDFTYKMRRWMRPLEKAYGEMYTGVFVCCPTLAELCGHAGILPWHKIHTVGHPFSSEEVMERMPAYWRLRNTAKYQNAVQGKRPNKVVFSSRFDSEKNPVFFCEVAKAVLARNPTCKFVVCTSAPKLRSNDPTALRVLAQARQMFPGRIEVKENLTKEQYYAELASAKIQFNCANQDFVPFTLLEGSVAGCFPVYPYFRSFPESLGYDLRYFYRHLDRDSAADLICTVLGREDEWTEKAVEYKSFIHRRFDLSRLRMLCVMNEGIRVADMEDGDLFGMFKKDDPTVTAALAAAINDPFPKR